MKPPGELWAMAVDRAMQSQRENEARNFHLPDENYDKMAKELMRIMLRQTNQACPCCGWKGR